MEISVKNEIGNFFHCELCINEQLDQDIEAGWTEIGLQVWCRNHECNILHVDFEGQKLPANGNRAWRREDIKAV